MIDELLYPEILSHKMKYSILDTPKIEYGIEVWNPRITSRYGTVHLITCFSVKQAFQFTDESQAPAALGHQPLL